MLIAVSDKRHISAVEFCEVEINDSREVIATLRSGERVVVRNGIGQTAWEIRDQLVSMINSALGE